MNKNLYVLYIPTIFIMLLNIIIFFINFKISFFILVISLTDKFVSKMILYIFSLILGFVYSLYYCFKYLKFQNLYILLF